MNSISFLFWWCSLFCKLKLSIFLLLTSVQKLCYLSRIRSIIWELPKKIFASFFLFYYSILIKLCFFVHSRTSKTYSFYSGLFRMIKGVIKTERSSRLVNFLKILFNIFFICHCFLAVCTLVFKILRCIAFQSHLLLFTLIVIFYWHLAHEVCINRME